MRNDFPIAEFAVILILSFAWIAAAFEPGSSSVELGEASVATLPPSANCVPLWDNSSSRRDPAVHLLESLTLSGAWTFRTPVPPGTR
jgi:hypothetical protein